MIHVGVKRLHSLTGHTDCIYALERGDSPHLFFSGGGDGMVVLWDLERPENGQLMAKLPNSIYALHLLRDSDTLVCGHNYEGIHVLNWREKREIRSLQLTASAIFDIQSFGKDLLVATGDGTVLVIDMINWSVRKRLSHAQKSARTLAINPMSGELAVGYSDHAIRIFDLADYGLKYEWVGHENSIFTLCYTPDFKTLLSGSRDARLKAWDASQKYQQEAEVVAHLYAINHITFSPDGKHFVTCSLDKSIKVWQTEGLRLLKVIDKNRHAGHGTSVNKLWWTSFDNELVSASDDRTIGIWEIIF